jgi:CRP-like cAMP-binding protein
MTTALRVNPLPGNKILGMLPNVDREALAPHLEAVPLKFRQRLEAANRKIRDVYFIEAGLASVVAVGSGKRRQAEVGVVGPEGMSGLAVIFGADRSPHETFMQVEGRGQRIAADALQAAISARPTLAASLLRYAHVFHIQAGHTALANAHGKIEERLARWLLMAHDRLVGDTLHLTHEFLSIMLGVRRAGVTTALHQLETSGLISTARGCVTILDRGGLEENANGLYGVPEAEYERLFP